MEQVHAPEPQSESAEFEPESYHLERIDPNDPRFAATKELEFEVFKSAGFLEQGDEEAGQLLGYRDYDQSSVFNAVYDKGRLAGVLREIRPSPKGFKTLNDFGQELYPEAKPELDKLDPNRTMEIGTVAVAPDYRGDSLGVALRLYGMMLKNSQEHGYNHWVASIDSGLLEKFRATYGFDFEPIGSARHYFGSETTPVLGQRDHMIDHLRSNAPFVYGAIVEGKYGDERIRY